ncbi:DUF6380 family protein [Streptomyces carpinensis]|uniref:DUF6380 family protein n=1 Tax=Streptomyces carpinensis TaxID=66369 RepID=A0ABV1VZ19_9ACTN
MAELIQTDFPGSPGLPGSPGRERRATPRGLTASLTATVGRGTPAHRGGRTGEGAR